MSMLFQGCVSICIHSYVLGTQTWVILVWTWTLESHLSPYIRGPGLK